MTEWYVRAYEKFGEDDILVVFRSRVKLLWWLIRNVGRVRYVVIFAGDYYDGYV